LPQWRDSQGRRLKLIVKQARLVGCSGDDFSKAVIERLLLHHSRDAVHRHDSAFDCAQLS
jgi:hypothetical protein